MTLMPMALHITIKYKRPDDNNERAFKLVRPGTPISCGGDDRHQYRRRCVADLRPVVGLEERRCAPPR